MSKTTSRAKKFRLSAKSTSSARKKVPYKILLSSMPEISFTSIKTIFFLARDDVYEF